MSDKHLNLARQTSPANGRSETVPISSTPEYSDEALVRRAKSDDAWAIEQLVLRYQQKAYAIAFQMLSGDAEDARDRTQDAFLQAFRRIRQFKGKSSFYTWFYRILINTCIDARRRRRRWQNIFFPLRSEKNNGVALEEIADSGRHCDPLETASHRQLKGDVKRVLNNLSEKQRTIFQLKVFHEMSIAEISESMGLAKGTVKTHLFRATRTVKKQLKGWAGI